MGWLSDDKKKPKKGSRPRVDGKKLSAKDVLKAIREGKTVTGYEPWCAENLGDDKVKNVPIKTIEAQKKKLGGLDEEGTFKNTRRNSVRDSLDDLRGQRSPRGKNPPAGAGGRGPVNEDGTPRKSWW
jgi:hypothetical protein